MHKPAAAEVNPPDPDNPPDNPPDNAADAAAAASKSIFDARQLDLSTALAKANAGFQYVAEGALLTYEQSWFSQGVALGDVRKTIPLAVG